MAVTAELMVIIMNINDRTHKTINFKKRKVWMILTGIWLLMAFLWTFNEI